MQKKNNQITQLAGKTSQKKKKKIQQKSKQNDQTVTGAREPIVHEKREATRCERTFELLRLRIWILAVTTKAKGG